MHQCRYHSTSSILLNCSNVILSFPLTPAQREGGKQWDAVGSWNLFALWLLSLRHACEWNQIRRVRTCISHHFINLFMCKLIAQFGHHLSVNVAGERERRMNSWYAASERSCKQTRQVMTWILVPVWTLAPCQRIWTTASIVSVENNFSVLVFSHCCILLIPFCTYINFRKNLAFHQLHKLILIFIFSEFAVSHCINASLTEQVDEEWYSVPQSMKPLLSVSTSSIMAWSSRCDGVWPKDFITAANSILFGGDGNVITERNKIANGWGKQTYHQEILCHHHPCQRARRSPWSHLWLALACWALLFAPALCEQWHCPAKAFCWRWPCPPFN